MKGVCYLFVRGIRGASPRVPWGHGQHSCLEYICRGKKMQIWVYWVRRRMKMSMNLWWLSIFDEQNLCWVWIFVPYIHTQTTMKMWVSITVSCVHTHTSTRPMWHELRMCLAWHMHMCDMLYTCMYAKWRIHVCNVAHAYVQHGACMCATWRIQVGGMTHASVRCDVFMWTSWLIRICDMMHACECITQVWAHLSSYTYNSKQNKHKIREKPWAKHALRFGRHNMHDACMFAMWHIHMRDMMLLCVPSVAYICTMTHTYVIWLIRTWHDSFIHDTTHFVCANYRIPVSGIAHEYGDLTYSCVWFEVYV